MSQLDDIVVEALDRRMDAVVTPENFHSHLKPLVEALDGRLFHHSQIRQVVEQWEAAVMAGERPSRSLDRIIEGVGKPGKKRDEVWDERFQD